MSKTLLITGATDGIGKELSRIAAAAGYDVTLHGRNSERLEEVKVELEKDFPKRKIQSILSDFSDLKATATAFKNYGKEFGMPDILVNNAGLLNSEKKLTVDGFEENFQVNYLSSFLVSQVLMNFMKPEKQYRVINVSSMIHATSLDFDNLNSEKYFSAKDVYSMTKLCNMLFTNKLTREYEVDKLLTASVHPGVVNTKLLRQQWGGGISPAEGAANVFFAVEFEALTAIPGAYIENRRPMQAADVAYSEEIQDKLWNYSMQKIKEFL